jgi:hypothetical protein
MQVFIIVNTVVMVVNLIDLIIVINTNSDLPVHVMSLVEYNSILLQANIITK